MPLDLMSALGAPAGGDSSAPAPTDNAAETGAKPSLLDREDPVFTAHLMDAVDDSLDPQSRAEALCQAIKAYVNGGGGVEDAEDEPAEPDADDAFLSE
jgi:hypothetical protein